MRPITKLRRVAVGVDVATVARRDARASDATGVALTNRICRPAAAGLSVDQAALAVAAAGVRHALIGSAACATIGNGTRFGDAVAQTALANGTGVATRSTMQAVV